MQPWQSQNRCFTTHEVLPAIIKCHAGSPSHMTEFWVLGNLFAFTIDFRVPCDPSDHHLQSSLGKVSWETGSAGCKGRGHWICQGITTTHPQAGRENPPKCWRNGPKIWQKSLVKVSEYWYSLNNCFTHDRDSRPNCDNKWRTTCINCITLPSFRTWNWIVLF